MPDQNDKRGEVVDTHAACAPDDPDPIDPHIITLFDEESERGLAFISFTPSLLTEKRQREGFAAWLMLLAECMNRGEDPRDAARDRKMSSGGWIKG